MQRYTAFAEVEVPFEAKDDATAMRLVYRMPRMLVRLPGAISARMNALHLRSEDGRLELRMQPKEDAEPQVTDPPIQRRQRRKEGQDEAAPNS